MINMLDKHFFYFRLTLYNVSYFGRYANIIQFTYLWPRKYYNHTLQTNPRHYEEDQQTTNSRKTSILEYNSTAVNIIQPYQKESRLNKEFMKTFYCHYNHQHFHKDHGLRDPLYV